METKTVWETYSYETKRECEGFCKEYMDFLSRAKTERECIAAFRQQLEADGYRPLGFYQKERKGLGPGDKVYEVHMDKTLVAFHIGSQPMEDGMNILAAHLDSPRLDLKQAPLYEKEGLVYLDTHYYGGIKKYQWVSMPLALHGVVIKEDGQRVELTMGEEPREPVFFISDLLIHLAQEQMKKKAEKVIEGEQLDVIIGSRELEPILRLLEEKYGITEEDFFSAEIEVVPAGQAREAGLDRSMVLAYGQDDKVCAYGACRAFIEDETPQRTDCLLLVDKEEIGSVGATGMESGFFENMVAEVLSLMEKGKEAVWLSTRRCLSKSRMLSADVNSGFDPTFGDCFEGKNSSYLGRGMVLSKFSGSSGKSGGNDANPEFIAYLRRIFGEKRIMFQMAELGKVDLGGGGTIAYIPARYGMEVVDCGIAVLNMHAPWEAADKGDIYEMKRGMSAFLTAKNNH